MVEDGDGVEDAEPLSWQVERIVRRQAGGARTAPQLRTRGTRRRHRAVARPSPARTRHPGRQRRVRARRAGLPPPHGVSLMTRDGLWPSIDQRATAPLPSTNSRRKQSASVPSARMVATGVESPMGSSSTTATTWWSVRRRRVSSSPGCGSFIAVAPWRCHPATTASPTYCAIRRAASSRFSIDAA